MELRLKLATSAAFVSALVSNRTLMPIFDRGQGSNYTSSRKNELRHLVGLAPKKRASLVAYVDGCTHCGTAAQLGSCPLQGLGVVGADSVPEM
jgi:hypothetical protein